MDTKEISHLEKNFKLMNYYVHINKIEATAETALFELRAAQDVMIATGRKFISDAIDTTIDDIKKGVVKFGTEYDLFCSYYNKYKKPVSIRKGVSYGF